MLDTFLNLFSEITFYLFLVTSIIFGISLAVNLFISNTVKKINVESNKNYKTLTVEEQSKCNEIISDVKKELSLIAKQTKYNKKVRQNNRFLKFFHLKEKSEIALEKDFKSVIRTSLKDIFNVFGSDGKKTYLSLSERDLFIIATTLKERLNNLIVSAKIIWLKRLPISVILYSLSVYNTAIKIKNKFFIALTLKIINFFSWFAKVLSPASLWKKIVKDLSGESLEEVVTNSLIEITAKELCVIYKNINDTKTQINI